jgi:hypothetical protein
MIGVKINIKKNGQEQKHCRTPTAQTHPQGSTRRAIVSATVSGNFLYIHNIEFIFNQLVVVQLCVFVVVQFDWYEWN